MSEPTDTERINWLQAHQKTTWRALRDEWQATTEADVTHRKVTVFEGWVIDEHDEPRLSIREAIDASMNKRKP